jgi:hypothetical protein
MVLRDGCVSFVLRGEKKYVPRRIPEEKLALTKMILVTLYNNLRHSTI